MKKIPSSFILIILISFVSCDTVTHYTIKVSVDRNPTLIIKNQTGHPVVVTAPVSLNINNGASTQFQPVETRGTINVTYRIGQIQFSEQATMDNADVTVTLTRRPPTITVVNQTGYQVGITAPVRLSIDIGSKTEFLAPELNKIININYTIGLIQVTEQVTMANQDVTVILPKRPTITLINQTGYQVGITAPVRLNIDIGSKTEFLAPELNKIININYTIGLIQVTEQVTMANQDVTVILPKRPTITLINQTGYQVGITAPVRLSIDIGSKTEFLAPELNKIININYTIGLMQVTEQVTMANQDVTVTLTKRPPTITIVNNVGATINTIFLRIPGSPSWVGGNIVIEGDTVQLVASRGASTNVISGSIVNRDKMKLWLGNVVLSGNIFDIRIDDVQGNSYVKSNVQVTNDMTLTFTQADKR